MTRRRRPRYAGAVVLLLLLGLALGVVLAIPVAVVWARRTGARVRRAEQRAQAAERLAELGTLTGGLAHEIKNPLSTIGLNIQLLDEDLQALEDKLRRTLGPALGNPPPPSEAGGDPPTARGRAGAAGAGAGSEGEQMGRVRRRLGTLSHETRRLREILDDFLRFAGRVRLEREPVDINAMMRELVDFYAPQAAEAKVRLRQELTADPPVIPADEHLLKQAILNLVINATQAMVEAREKQTPHGGADELIVRTGRGKRLGEWQMRIDVIDTGPGMPEGAGAKIFQPYFSTKRGGTGLGLPTARRIIEEHGGRLELHAEEGRGSDFTIVLPTQAPEQNADE